jgi:hypothetical protein
MKTSHPAVVTLVRTVHIDARHPTSHQQKCKALNPPYARV